MRAHHVGLIALGLLSVGAFACVAPAAEDAESISQAYAPPSGSTGAVPSGTAPPPVPTTSGGGCRIPGPETARPPYRTGAENEYEVTESILGNRKSITTKKDVMKGPYFLYHATGQVVPEVTTCTTVSQYESKVELFEFRCSSQRPAGAWEKDGGHQYKSENHFTARFRTSRNTSYVFTGNGGYGDSVSTVRAEYGTLDETSGFSELRSRWGHQDPLHPTLWRVQTQLKNGADVPLSKRVLDIHLEDDGSLSCLYKRAGYSEDCSDEQDPFAPWIEERHFGPPRVDERCSYEKALDWYRKNVE